MKKELEQEIISLIKNAKNVFVASVNEVGFPTIKAMLNLHHNGLFVHYFSTNLSSKRSNQFLKNDKACIYFCNEAEFKGLMFSGHMEVMTDKEHKAMLWREGFECYYPNGVDTEDYCVYKFTSDSGNYYHGLANFDFTKEDIEDA